MVMLKTIGVDEGVKARFFVSSSPTAGDQGRHG